MASRPADGFADLCHDDSGAALVHPFQICADVRRYGQNILANREGTLDWGINGTIYAVPDIPAYPFAMAIRKDWMANLGMKVPEERVVSMDMDTF